MTTVRRRLVARHLEANVLDALADTRVVAILGPRQAGKSTLVRSVASRWRRTQLVSLDDEDTLAAAKADPRTFVDRDVTLVIDEVQRAPELFRAIKVAVDNDPRPGRFVLTGSTHRLAVRELSDALAGRVELLELDPFSRGELEGVRETFVDGLFSRRRWPSEPLRHSRADYVGYACTGGYPEVVFRTPSRRRAWFRSYVQTVCEHEAAGVADLDRPDELPALLRLAATRHAGLLNKADLARDAGMSQSTLSRYMGVLAAVFLVRFLPAWSVNLTAKVARAPKLYVADSGLAAYLRGVTPSSVALPARSRGAEGPIIEGFVLGEIRKQIWWSDTEVELFHFRDRQGIEVDIVLETADGRVAGIEVKSSTVVRDTDFKGLRLLRDRLGARFARGVVLHTGHQTLSYGDRLVATPIGRLWATPPRRRKSNAGAQSR